MLMTIAADDPEAQPRFAAFRQGLQRLGWTDGRDVRVDTRWFPGGAANARKPRPLALPASRGRRSGSPWLCDQFLQKRSKRTYNAADLGTCRIVNNRSSKSALIVEMIFAFLAS